MITEIPWTSCKQYEITSEGFLKRYFKNKKCCFYSRVSCWTLGNADIGNSDVWCVAGKLELNSLGFVKTV